MLKKWKWVFKLILSTIFFCLAISPLIAQPTMITGKVTDQTGASFPGVSVIEKGTTNGVTTDNDGNFSLAIPPVLEL